MAAISGTMAAIIGATAIAAGGAGYALSQGGKEKKKEVPTALEAPTPESAEEKAKEEMKKRRKISDRTGGKTILSSRYGGNTDTTTKNLLGE